MWLRMLFISLLVYSGCLSAADYRIERVKENVYRFSAGHYHSVFMVTQSGVFVTDPINPKAASYNGRGSVSMRFMPANVLYVVDWIVIGRMPYKDLPGYDIHGMIHSTQEILRQPAFDVFVGGHAEMGTRHDVQRYLNYLQDLYLAVVEGMLDGKSLAELQAEIKLDDYRDLAMYEEWLPLNIKGVHDTLLAMSYFDRR